MRVVKFEMFVSTSYVGSETRDMGAIEVDDNATEREIRASIEDYTREWMFDNIDWGFEITEENV